MIFINMQTSATRLLENIIREELVLLQEQDPRVQKLQKQIEELTKQRENATHEEQEDRIDRKISELAKQIRDIKDEDSEQEQIPDESWLGRPVPPPDQYTGKNGNKSKLDLFNNDYSIKGGKTINVELSEKAAFSFYRLYNDMPKLVRDSITKIFSFRTYKSQYNLIDWEHWKKTRKYRTISQNGKVFPAAKPGTSKHGIGMAIDIYPAGVQAWMEAKAKDYGWIQNIENDEPHFRYFPDRDKSK